MLQGAEDQVLRSADLLLPTDRLCVEHVPDRRLHLLQPAGCELLQRPGELLLGSVDVRFGLWFREWSDDPFRGQGSSGSSEGRARSCSEGLIG